MKRNVLILVAACSALFGCSAQNPEGVLRLDESTAKGSCRAGETVEVALASNAATGYMWRVVKDGSPAFKFGGEQYEPSNPQLCGSGGKTVFVFVAENAGEAALSFKYARPWEKDGDSKTIAFKVSVKK